MKLVISWVWCIVVNSGFSPWLFCQDVRNNHGGVRRGFSENGRMPNAVASACGDPLDAALRQTLRVQRPGTFWRSGNPKVREPFNHSISGRGVP
jgi:hypothetical protein